MNKYQLFDDIDPASYDQLKNSILEKGVLVPIETDENGDVLDGHHRIKICKELGIKEWPILVRKGMSESEKKNHARVLNLARRHLTKDQRKKVWADMRKDGMTLEAIAEADGTVSHETVRTALDDPTFKNLKVDKPTTTGKDGKKRPTKYKPRKQKTVFVSTEAVKKAQTLPEEQKQAVLTGDKKIMAATREAKVIEISKTVILPDTKYRVIYADPPWSYGNTQPDYHIEQRDHYPVMSLKDICALPVSDMTIENAVLFLWVTSPILEESFQVINAWGFKYKASFVWDKIKHNMGHYNSVRHEFLLVCTKGSCQPDVNKLYDSVISEDRTKHSKKPDCVYEIIETLYPYGKKIELFARDKKDGWDVYGFEA